MKSTFYTAKFDRRFPVTYLLTEHVAELMESNGVSTEEEVLACIRRALVECGAMSKPKDEDVIYVAQRLSEERQSETEEGGGTDQNLDGKAFGGGFGEWIKGLTPDKVCMFVTGYDYEKAMYLYCEVDRADVQALADTRVCWEWEQAKIRFESALFGFGGGYGKDNSFDPDTAGDEGVLQDQAKVKELNEMLRL